MSDEKGSLTTKQASGLDPKKPGVMPPAASDVAPHAKKASTAKKNDS